MPTTILDDSRSTSRLGGVPFNPVAHFASNRTEWKPESPSIFNLVGSSFHRPKVFAVKGAEGCTAQIFSGHSCPLPSEYSALMMPGAKSPSRFSAGSDTCPWESCFDSDLFHNAALARSSKFICRDRAVALPPAKWEKYMILALSNYRE